MESIPAVQGKHGPEVGENNSAGFRNASLLKKKRKGHWGRQKAKRSDPRNGFPPDFQSEG